MTRFISTVLYLFCTIHFCGCKPKNILKTTTPKKIEREVLQERLPERYYLKNRMDNCEDKISYMQNIIDYPEGDAETKIFLSKKDGGILGSYKSFVSGVRERTKLPDLDLFYFDLECFESQHYSNILPLLLPPDQYREVDDFLKNNPHGNYGVEGLVVYVLCFSFRIIDNKVAYISVCKKSNIPGFKIYDN